MPPGSIPAGVRKGLTEDQATCYTWLAANGIAEWLPETCTIRIGMGQIVYDSFVWNDGVERGFNSDFAATCDPGLSDRVLAIASPQRLGPADAIIERRTVPLLVPPTEAVRNAFARNKGVDLREQS